MERDNNLILTSMDLWHTFLLEQYEINNMLAKIFFLRLLKLPEIKMPPKRKL